MSASAIWQHLQRSQRPELLLSQAIRNLNMVMRLTREPLSHSARSFVLGVATTGPVLWHLTTSEGTYRLERWDGTQRRVIIVDRCTGRGGVGSFLPDGRPGGAVPTMCQQAGPWL
jgi:hypothetical protein